MVDDFARAATRRLCDRRLRAFLFARYGRAPARMRAERHRPGQGGGRRDPRQAAALRSGAVVLVGPVRGQAADRRPARRLRGIETVGDPAAGRFSVEYRKAGKLIAVDAINDGRAYMPGRQRLAEETAAA